MESITENHNRKAGVLLPVSALPGSQGIGTLGAGAYAFIDWLYASGMKIWQVLPLLPTGYGDSPYQSYSAGALNYYFIDFELLEKDGLLQKSDYDGVDFACDIRRVDYGKQFQNKTRILRLAFDNFDEQNAEWKAFVESGKYYDFALFMSLKVRFNYAPWETWEKPFKNRQKKALLQHETEYEREIRFWQFTQFLFLKQWYALHAYANEKGISIMGDMPIYLAYDSVETWKERKRLFMLDKKGNTSKKAGVPPDAFSEDGQLWGNPVYDWEKHAKENYAWWKERIAYNLRLYDIVRIDHFRAFDRFFAIDKDAETAKDGAWLDGPKEELFKGLENCAIVAEDLGIIDDGVRRLLKNTGYPGMKVFVFAFDGNPENEYLPALYNENCVAYTGTHDNEPLRAFIENMDKDERKRFETELEKQCLLAETPYITETVEDECKSVIELLFSSKANVVILPMQDILCMGEEARLNAPSTVTDKNWTFRFIESDLRRGKSAWLKNLTLQYNR